MELFDEMLESTNEAPTPSSLNQDVSKEGKKRMRTDNQRKAEQDRQILLQTNVNIYFKVRR